MLTVAQLNAMSVKDLIKLNKMIVTTVKNKQRLENECAIFNFRKGDKVSYESSRFGRPVEGEVVEVKRTKVVVLMGGKQYLVPASMLRAA